MESCGASYGSTGSTYPHGICVLGTTAIGKTAHPNLNRVYNRNSIGRQAEEWKNGAIKQQTYWRGDLSKRSEEREQEREQGARTRTRKRWWMSSQSAVETDYGDLYGSYLKRKEHLASDKRASVPSSEWNPASPEPTGMWMWMCRLMYAYRKLRPLGARCLSQMAHLFFIASSTKNYTTVVLARDSS